MIKNRIALLRKEAGFNQRELGIKLGVGQTTVSAWETGKNEPDNDSMHKMAQLFNCSIGYLMGYENNHQTRGLTQEQIIEDLHQRQQAAEISKWEREEEYRQTGLTPEEIEEIIADSLYQEWQANAPEMYFELYQISKMFEYLTEEQRKRVVTVVENMFPYAVKRQHTDEIPR